MLLFIQYIKICDILFLSLAAELTKDTLGKLLPICAILKVRNILKLRTDLYSNTLLVCVCQLSIYMLFCLSIYQINHSIHSSIVGITG